MPNDVSGPLFDGRAAQAVRDYCGKAQDAVAAEAVNLVRQRLDDSLRVNTGRYPAGIRTDRRQDERVVNDGGAVMGPWLEGTGSRNRTTRFKGYFSFRLAVQDLQGKVGDVAEAELPPYLEAMN